MSQSTLGEGNEIYSQSLLIEYAKELLVGSTQCLSKAGKLTLLKAVLSAIPTYTMSCFELPVSMCKRIGRGQTRFWWDGPDKKRKMSWVAWNRLTKSKAEGERTWIQGHSAILSSSPS